MTKSTKQLETIWEDMIKMDIERNTRFARYDDMVMGKWSLPP